MILKSLSLKNIRSYKEQTINFPEGSILLAGDIGSGKTSILLAIEFALFGIIKNELSPKSLLRHGTTEGSVTLSFQINDTTYQIRRTLKRDTKGIKQATGTLITDKNQELLTPVELKARILHILGYPQSILTKSKSLLFRYTIYTPQEEMKKILYEPTDIRLETLRKVFCIDQYKTIQNNTNTILKELRAESKALKIQLEELPFKEKELEELQKTIQIKEQELNQLIAEEKLIATKLEKEKDQLTKLEKEKEEFQERKNKLLLAKAQLQNLLTKEAQLNQQKTLLAKKPEEYTPLNIADQLTKRKQQKELIESKITKATQKKDNPPNKHPNNEEKHPETHLTPKHVSNVRTERPSYT